MPSYSCAAGFLRSLPVFRLVGGKVSRSFEAEPETLVGRAQLRHARFSRSSRSQLCRGRLARVGWHDSEGDLARSS